jgi:hypothetical protein
MVSAGSSPVGHLQIGNGSHEGIFPSDGLRVLHLMFYEFGFRVLDLQQFDIFIRGGNDGI